MDLMIEGLEMGKVGNYFMRVFLQLWNDKGMKHDVDRWHRLFPTYDFWVSKFVNPCAEKRIKYISAILCYTATLNFRNKKEILVLFSTLCACPISLYVSHKISLFLMGIFIEKRRF